ncbi:MAG: class I SAM-dependent methyltransferase [Nitrospirae bacterium]|nr:class I SAM-dependent methyltransferase [Nitrospirota bacterium]
MLTEAEYVDLYSRTYREEGLNNKSVMRVDQGRAALVEEWISARVGLRGLDRRLLDVGCGSGAYLVPFRKRGWQVVGIEPQPRWAEQARDRLGLHVMTGFYDRATFHEQSFDLILLSHVIEHLPDPRPLLATVRGHLAPGGLVFIGTPNVAMPKLEPCIGSFNTAHVRLFSLNTLSRLLSECGFAITASETLWPRYGLAVLAEPCDGPGTDAPSDDASAIRQLYEGLSPHGSADVLGRNLAALARIQPWILPALCQWHDARPYRLLQQGGRIVALVREDHHKQHHGLVRWGNNDEAEAVRLESSDDSGTIVQLGLGSGDLARTLVSGLTNNQHLFIWEAEPALAKLILKSVDLGDLWASGRVTLLLGTRPALPSDQVQRLRNPSYLYTTATARHWHTRAYQQILDFLHAKAVALEPAGGIHARRDLHQGRGVDRPGVGGPA